MTVEAVAEGEVGLLTAGAGVAMRLKKVGKSSTAESCESGRDGGVVMGG